MSEKVDQKNQNQKKNDGKEENEIDIPNSTTLNYDHQPSSQMQNQNQDIASVQHMAQTPKNNSSSNAPSQNNQDLKFQEYCDESSNEIPNPGSPEFLRMIERTQTIPLHILEKSHDQ